MAASIWTAKTDWIPPSRRKDMFCRVLPTRTGTSASTPSTRKHPNHETSDLQVWTLSDYGWAFYSWPNRYRPAPRGNPGTTYDFDACHAAARWIRSV